LRPFRRLLLVAVLCGLAVVFLSQHSYSNKLTRTLSRLDRQRQLLAERLDSVDAEIVGLSGFARTESLWTAQGRPTASEAALRDTSSQTVVVASRGGRDESVR